MGVEEGAEVAGEGAGGAFGFAVEAGVVGGFDDEGEALGGHSVDHALLVGGGGEIAGGEEHLSAGEVAAGEVVGSGLEGDGEEAIAGGDVGAGVGGDEDAGGGAGGGVG